MADWPKHGPSFNAWYGDFAEFAAVLTDAANEAWWSSDPQLKYLELRIDTRDNGFLLFDRDREQVSPDRVVAAIAKYRAFVGGAVKLRGAP